MRLSPRFIIVDIGNSAMKFALAADLSSPTWLGLGRSEFTPSWDVGDVGKFADLPGESCSWLVSSVNRGVCQELERWIDQHRRADRLILITHDDVDFDVIPQSTKMLGMDRLMAAAAAIHQFHRDNSAPKNLIIIDAGTAVTIDAVDAHSRFLGGTIRPGIRLQRGALHQYTDALPDLSQTASEDNLPEFVFGHTTREAILGGTGYGELGAIMAIVQLMDDQLEGDSQVILTGAGAQWMLDWFPAEWKWDPDLVLQGIRITGQELVAVKKH